jgi:hypothetical protein
MKGTTRPALGVSNTSYSFSINPCGRVPELDEGIASQGPEIWFRVVLPWRPCTILNLEGLQGWPTWYHATHILLSLSGPTCQIRVPSNVGQINHVLAIAYDSILGLLLWERMLLLPMSFPDKLFPKRNQVLLRMSLDPTQIMDVGELNDVAIQNQSFQLP